jgi:hypothetical protein
VYEKGFIFPWHVHIVNTRRSLLAPLLWLKSTGGPLPVQCAVSTRTQAHHAQWTQQIKMYGGLKAEVRQPHISLVSHTVHTHTHRPCCSNTSSTHRHRPPASVLFAASPPCVLLPLTRASLPHNSIALIHCLIISWTISFSPLRPSFLTHLGGRNVDSFIGPRWSAYRIYFAFK